MKELTPEARALFNKKRREYYAKKKEEGTLPSDRMTKKERQAYNREYYRKNKDKLKQKKIDKLNALAEKEGN